MAEKITQSEIVEKLGNDPAFGIDFIIDNQPDIILDRLKQNGYDTTDTRDKARIVLNELLASNPELLVKIVNNVPYDSSRENYTGGLSKAFPQEAGTVAKSDGENTALWAGILTGLGGLAQAIGLGLGSTGVQGGTLTQQQMLALQEQQRLQAERERQRRNQNLIIWGLVAIVGTVIIVAIVRSNKKGSSK